MQAKIKVPISLTICGVMFATVFVVAALAKKPDLIVSSFTFSNSSPVVGEVVQMDIKVKNIGDHWIHPVNYLTLRVWDDSAYFDGVEGPSTLDPGEEILLLSHSVSFSTPGTHTLTAKVDWEVPDRINESDETNNEMSVQVDVLSPPATPTLEVGPASLYVNAGGRDVTVEIYILDDLGNRMDLDSMSPSIVYPAFVTLITVKGLEDTDASGEPDTYVVKLDRDQFQAQGVGTYTVLVTGTYDLYGDGTGDLGSLSADVEVFDVPRQKGKP